MAQALALALAFGHAGRVWPRGARLATLWERRWDVSHRLIADR
ncbi:hypothetical protein [Moorena sp. SIO4G3]|nr:hypothetical protein [Moorena sp. SIO4G3]